jgi:hypothetical protein
MPVFAFLAVVGLLLVVSLFIADATLENGPPPIVTSSRVGLPERWHPDKTKVLTHTTAPAPDMSSPAVRAAQPGPDHDALAKISAAARAARAEDPPERNRAPHTPHPQNSWGDKFSIGGQ